MKKKSIIRYSLKNLPPDTKSNWKKIRAMTNSDIDKAIADDPDAAPILDDDFFKNAKLTVSAAGKERISIMIDKDVLSFFRNLGQGYQSRINAVLRAYAHTEATRHSR